MKTISDTKTAIGYCRVSTAGQAIDGVSLAAQRAKIEAWAALNDFELLSVHQDAISGKSATNRPSLQAALGEACGAGAALVVYSLSRLARSTKDAILISERLDKANADLVSVTESIDTTSAAGRMVFKLLSVLAEFERETIAERTRMAMAHMRQQGQRISGRIPYGRDLAPDQKSLQPNVAEQTIIVRMKTQRAKGWTLRRIAGRLEQDGVKNKGGDIKWAAATVSGILQRNNGD